VEHGIETNFLGARTRKSYWEGERRDLSGGEFEYPAFDENYFEWIDLLESVTEAGSEFRMMELGAGYGRWSVNGALASLQLGKDFRITAVEPEPQHFKWLQDNISVNELEPDRFRLIEAAVTDHLGKSLFLTGKPSIWYGQGIPSMKYRPQKKDLVMGKIKLSRVRAVTLTSLLYGEGIVDLVDIDVQGVEQAVLRPAEDVLKTQVKRVHIGTHSREIEQGLRTFFARNGWKTTYDYPGGGVHQTEFGPVEFTDGVQGWKNPSLT
jgi:FkbM family methyltransferase